MSAAYVRCKVQLGLFDGEFYVLINGSSSVYVNKVNVQTNATPEPNKQVEGKVLAYVISEREDKSLVEVPGEPVVGGLRTWVPKSQVVYA